MYITEDYQLEPVEMKRISVSLEKNGRVYRENFEFVEKVCVDGVMEMENAEDVANLFMMTPYYYKTSQEDTEKLLASPPKEIEYSFEILVFKKK